MANKVHLRSQVRNFGVFFNFSLSLSNSTPSIHYYSHSGTYPIPHHKNSAVLLSRDGYLLEPTVCPKGSQASCGVWIEDPGLLSRPCISGWDLGPSAPERRNATCQDLSNYCHKLHSVFSVSIWSQVIKLCRLSQWSLWSAIWIGLLGNILHCWGN